MEKDSLGLIETLGFVGAIEAVDAGCKAARVTFRGYERGRAGLITVVFTGDVAAVRAAVSAGVAAAQQVGKVVSTHVIARPDRQLHVGSPNRSKPAKTVTAAAGTKTAATARPVTTQEISAIPAETSLEAGLAKPVEQEKVMVAKATAFATAGVAKLEDSLSPAAAQKCREALTAGAAGQDNGDFRSSETMGAGEIELPAPTRKKEKLRRMKGKKKV